MHFDPVLIVSIGKNPWIGSFARDGLDKLSFTVKEFSWKGEIRL